VVVVVDVVEDELDVEEGRTTSIGEVVVVDSVDFGIVATNA
jgi:hypothetical protein